MCKIKARQRSQSRHSEKTTVLQEVAETQGSGLLLRFFDLIRKQQGLHEPRTPELLAEAWLGNLFPKSR